MSAISGKVLASEKDHSPLVGLSAKNQIILGNSDDIVSVAEDQRSDSLVQQVSAVSTINHEAMANSDVVVTAVSFQATAAQGLGT